MTTAAICARRSTAAQDASLERQIAECEHYAEARGWVVSDTYTDSASGWKQGADRPGFDSMMVSMMVDASAGAFDVLLVWEASRLSRQEGDDSALAMCGGCASWASTSGSIVEVSTGNTLADDLNLLIKSHLAKDESDVKSARVRSGKRRSMLSGTFNGPSAGYGYRKLAKEQRNGRFVTPYEVDPDQARIVDEVFTAYVDEGRSPQEICDELNRRGVAPPDGDRPHHAKRMPGTTPQWFQGLHESAAQQPPVRRMEQLPPRADQGVRLLGHRAAVACDQGR